MRVPPTRQEHPLPALVMHWVHLISLLVLIVTGIYIWKPYYGGAMGINRTLHFTFMWIFGATMIVRIYWAFAGGGSAAVGQTKRYPDYHWFWFPRGSLRQLGRTFKYYFFARDNYPRMMKYNPLQKGTYLFWILLVALSTLSGVCIWEPTMSFFQPVTHFFGGLAAMRTIHYWIMWAFIVTVAVHVYLVFAEVVWEVPLMFFWKEVGREARKDPEA